ncbi:MAG: tetratricopeptide repeat protein [Candidatus Heimdallarchaeum aukensis]|uniref:Tetratricopeptide repeat protein n=1 Tax=Candidatus Heimdallarchaeum aukensis TaxID=2876573 RepID=A0A9Y1BL04_9ARCH|nr:MAG: tetratricopeptide repeat protein [Candidatus Heimdallarchaeum aukensis]
MSVVYSFPREYSHYIPLFTREEQDLINNFSSKVNKDTSMGILKDILLDILDNLSSPSLYFLYSLGKVLFISSNYNLLEELNKKYKSESLELWWGNALIRRTENDKVINLALKILNKNPEEKIIRLHCYALLANAYANMESENQYRHYMQELYHESIIFHRDLDKEKIVINDILLFAHAIDIWKERISAPLLKLENKIDVAFQIAKELGDRYHLGRLYNIRGVIYRYVGRISDSFEFINKAINYYKAVGARRGVAAAKANLATIYTIKNELDKAEKLLKESLSIFLEVGDYKNQSLIHSSLGEIAIAKGDYHSALELYEESVSILEQINAHELQVYCSLGELYYFLGNKEKMKIIMKFLQETDKKKEGFVYGYYNLFKALLEIDNMNYGKANEYLEKALSISDTRGTGFFSAKILLQLSLINIKQYDSFQEKEYLEKAKQYINDLEPFYEELNKTIEHVIILLVLSKIYAVMEEYTKSFNILQKAKDRLNLSKKERKKDKYYHLIENRIKELEEIFSKAKTETSFQNETFQYEIKEMESISIRQISEYEKELRTSILALLIVHPSGIPLMNYTLKRSSQFRDELMFGGFIVAVKDMIEELFSNPMQSKVMVISYGNNKIIMEHSPKRNFSVIILSSKDSFILRRKIHRLTQNLQDIELPQQYIGELTPKTASRINEEVKNVFGENLMLYEGAVHI